MSLDMLLQILRTLESLPAKFASMRFERNMDADVRGDVVALYDGNMAIGPTAGQIKVVGAFATDMSLADMFLQ